MTRDLKIGILTGIIIGIGIIVVISIKYGDLEQRQKATLNTDSSGNLSAIKSTDTAKNSQQAPTEQEFLDSISRSNSTVPTNRPTITNQAQTGENFIIHTVQKGETLSTIAKFYYGDVQKITKIIEANKDIITNPDMVPAGVKLKIPQ